MSPIPMSSDDEPHRRAMFDHITSSVVGIFAFVVDLDFSRMGVTAFGLVFSPRSIATRRDAAVVPGMHRGTPATPSVPPSDGSADRMEAARIRHPDSQSDGPQPAATPTAKHPIAIHTRSLARDPEVPVSDSPALAPKPSRRGVRTPAGATPLAPTLDRVGAT